MRLKTCFGCLSLQTGTVAIGIMSIVWAMFSAVSAFPLMDTLRNDKLDLIIQFTLKTLFTAVLIHIVVTGGMAGLMIYGARNKKPAFVFPWFALFTTDLLLSGSISSGAIVTAPIMLPITWFFVLLAISTVFLGIHFYLWLVVHSYYKQIVIEKYRVSIPVIDVENLDHQQKTGCHDV